MPIFFGGIWAGGVIYFLGVRGNLLPGGNTRVMGWRGLFYLGGPVNMVLFLAPHC